MDHDAEKHYELQPLSQRKGSGTALHCNFRNYTLYLNSTTNLLLYIIWYCYLGQKMTLNRRCNLV